MKIASLARILPLVVTMFGMATASPIPDFPFIMADGSVERDVPPTNATVSFKVLAFSKTAEESTNTVQNALVKVIEALKAEGMEENMIQAHDLDKSVVRKRNTEVYADTDVLGYEVSRKVVLSIPDLANYPKLARVIMITEHVTQVESAFETSKREEIEAELVGEACAKARRKANLLAKGAGVTIERVFAISDRDFGYIGSLTESPKYSSFSAAHGPSLDGSALEVALFVPSKITVQANVNILFKLLQ